MLSALHPKEIPEKRTQAGIAAKAASG